MPSFRTGKGYCREHSTTASRMMAMLRSCFARGCSAAPCVGVDIRPTQRPALSRPASIRARFISRGFCGTCLVCKLACSMRRRTAKGRTGRRWATIELETPTQSPRPRLRRNTSSSGVTPPCRSARVTNLDGAVDVDAKGTHRIWIKVVSPAGYDGVPSREPGDVFI